MGSLVALYTLASAVHFAHNAEYIAFYPGLPSWLTREHVYLAWLPIASTGLIAMMLLRFGWRLLGWTVLAIFGLLGTDGLLHYTLALCSEHTLTTNLTIWAEVLLGIALACASAVQLSRSRHSTDRLNMLSCAKLHERATKV